jgi:hypothetical protein
MKVALVTQSAKSAWSQETAQVYSAVTRYNSTTVSKTSSDVANQCENHDSLQALLEDMKNTKSFQVIVLSIRLETEHLLE